MRRFNRVMIQRLRSACLLAAIALTACTSYEPLDVRVIGIRALDSSPFEQRLRIDLRVVNPNPREIAATGMALNLNVNGQPLARGVSDQAVVVPRLGEAVTHIDVGTSLFDIARQLVTLSERRAEVTYGIDGRLFLSGMRPSIHFEESGILPGFKSP